MLILEQNSNFYLTAITYLRDFIKDKLGWEIANFIIPVVELIVWILIMLIINLALKAVFIPIIRKITTVTKTKWDDVFFRHKVFRSFIHFIVLSVGYNLIPTIFPYNSGLQNFGEKLIGALLILNFIQICNRILRAVMELSRDDESYTTVSIRTFAQMLNIFFIFTGIIAGIAILFDVQLSTIITVMGALTAAVILIFREYILGFISGLQISHAKILKVGDWVHVGKGDIEGIVREVNINLVKIENFDKSVTTVPTVDLITGKVVNYEPMLESGTRNIRKNFFFKASSIHFCDDEKLDFYEKIGILTEFIAAKKAGFNESKDKIPNADIILNRENQLTNIGLFRKYIYLYLYNHPDISKPDRITVKLKINPNGSVLLDVDCFTLSSEKLFFDKIQSGIIEHLISASQIFELRIEEN